VCRRYYRAVMHHQFAVEVFSLLNGILGTWMIDGREFELSALGNAVCNIEAIKANFESPIPPFYARWCCIPTTNWFCLPGGGVRFEGRSNPCPGEQIPESGYTFDRPKRLLPPQNFRNLGVHWPLLFLSIFNLFAGPNVVQFVSRC
jgi:hypothetical protein